MVMVFVKFQKEGSRGGYDSLGVNSTLEEDEDFLALK